MAGGGKAPHRTAWRSVSQSRCHGHPSCGPCCCVALRLQLLHGGQQQLAGGYTALDQEPSGDAGGGDDPEGWASAAGWPGGAHGGRGYDAGAGQWLDAQWTSGADWVKLAWAQITRAARQPWAAFAAAQQFGRRQDSLRAEAGAVEAGGGGIGVGEALPEWAEGVADPPLPTSGPASSGGSKVMTTML